MGQQQLKLSKFKKNQGNTGRFCMRPRWYEVFFKEVDFMCSRYRDLLFWVVHPQCFSFSFSSCANPLWSISYNHFSFPLIVDLFYWNFTWQALCNFSDCGVSWFFFFPKVFLDSCLCNQTCYIRFCKCDPLKGF